ncbi:MAG: helicase, partial [Nannocystaceae bacterium]|nr:helicase [Nannocystaceae bacterium]
MKSLLVAIREACSPGTWSRGVELARNGAVVGEADEGEEIVLRVRLKGAVASPQVVLFPDDDDWTCDCKFREDACPHVAAAAIALKQARNEGKALPGLDENGVPPHVAYRLEALGKKLVLRRVVATDGNEDEGIRGSLAQLSQGGTAGVLVTDADLQFERRFGTVVGGVISRERMEDVLHALRDVADVTLNKNKVEIGPATSGLCARLHDVGDDIRVVLEQDPAVKTIYENGAIVREGKVHAFAPHGLRESDFRRFREGAIFGPSERGTVAGDVLPRLKRHLPVIIETDRLPKARTIRPRLHIATARQGNSLEVFPTIVYGDPPVARVDGDRLTLLGDGRAAPVRNFELEKRLGRQLQDGLGLEAGQRRKLATGEALAWTKRADRLDTIDFQGNAHTEFYEAGTLDPHLETSGDGAPELWFESDGGASNNGSGARVDAAAIMRAWENDEDLVPLLDGGFGRIPAEWLSQHGHRVMALLAAKQAAADERELPAWAWADVAAVAEALEQPPPPEFERLRGVLDNFAGIGEPELPEDLTATLRDYQRTGVAWLNFLRGAQLGALLADDMGLGKTLQALCSIHGKTLVVAPTSVIPNWGKEVAKFRPALTTSVYHGPARALDDADITLTTYALLRLDLDKLSAVKWDTVILDESQAIKNPDSKVARAAFELPAKWRIAMTGTPVENRLDDLWSQFHFLNPGFLGGRTDFQKRYVKPMAAGDATTAASLR